MEDCGVNQTCHHSGSCKISHQSAASSSGNPGFSGWMRSLKDIWSPPYLGSKSSPHPCQPGLGRTSLKGDCRVTLSLILGGNNPWRTHLRRVPGFKEWQPLRKTQYRWSPVSIPVVSGALNEMTCHVEHKVTLQATRQFPRQSLLGLKLLPFSWQFSDWSEERLDHLISPHMHTSDCTFHCIQKRVNC